MNLSRIEGEGGAIGLELTVGDAGIAWLRLSSAGGAIRLGIRSMRALEAAVAEVEERSANAEIRGLVVASDPSAEVAGYDLEEIRGMTEDELIAWSHEAQGILRRLEDLSVVTVAAIEGSWSGAGVELALACDSRVASVQRAARIELPQLSMGLIPAWGGTVRLPRLIGLDRALRLMVEGSVDIRTARKIGLLDRVYPSRDFAARVERFAVRRAEADRKARAGLVPMRPLLERTAPGRRLVALRAARRHLAATENGAAGRLVLDLMLANSASSPARGYARESAVAGKLLLQADMRGRLHVDRLIDDRRRAVAMAAIPETAAVVGHGHTASDIAHLLATAGVAVRFKGGDRRETREGVARAHRRLIWEQTHDRISDSQARQHAERIKGVSGFGEFGTLDLVLAVPEGRTRPGELLAEVERHVRPDTVLAYHHWTAAPTEVQRELRHPQRAVALTPAFPADLFPLLEITAGAATSPATTAAAVRLAERCRLVPIVVGSSPSPGTRLLAAYLAEASRLLAEGATVSQVDAAVEDFGFAVGPFRRIDAIGSVRALDLLEAMAEVFGERMRPTPPFVGIGRGGSTFYRYRNGVPAGPNPALPAGLSQGGRTVTDLIRRRILLLLIEEAGRILAEGEVARPEDLDLISVLGVGFPRERGGILFHAEERGMPAVVDELSRMAQRSGERFGPARILVEHARSGRSFYMPDEPSRLDRLGDPC
jgi:3-hydroxyacyl-CoA dehydrogenase / enoyl-CoA hydratase / 3-hydroxybutyryl-CoA epimerase